MKQKKSKKIPEHLVKEFLLPFLDTPSLFKCLLINKQWYNFLTSSSNIHIWISLYNQLFVIPSTDKITELIEHPPSFKIQSDPYDEEFYTGICQPNENYCFTKDYYRGYEQTDYYSLVTDHLKKNYMTASTLTLEKLKVWKNKCKYALQIYKKKQQNKSQPCTVVDKQNESHSVTKQSSTNNEEKEQEELIKFLFHLIKTRWFRKRYFNNELICKEFRCRARRYFFKFYNVFYYGNTNQEERKIPETAYNSQNVKEEFENWMYQVYNDNNDDNEQEKPENDPCQVESLVFGWITEELVNNYLLSKKDEMDYYLKKLKAVFVNDVYDPEQMISYIYNSQLNGLLQRFKNLQVLGARGRIESFHLCSHNHLQILILVTGGLNGDVFETITKCNFPNLKHLELWCGSRNYGNNIEQKHLTYLLSEEETGQFPLLEYLGLKNFQYLDDYLEMVGNSNILTRIRILDISLSGVTPDGIRSLMQGMKKRGREAYSLLELIDCYQNACYRMGKETVVLELIEFLGHVLVDFCTQRRYIAVSE
ncbi:hypothetical protein ABK040_011197 [Willaertia magna]